MLEKPFLLSPSARAPHPEVAQTPRRSRLPLGILALQQSAYSCLQRRGPCTARLKLLQELHRLRLVGSVQNSSPAALHIAQLPLALLPCEPTSIRRRTLVPKLLQIGAAPQGHPQMLLQLHEGLPQGPTRHQSPVLPGGTPPLPMGAPPLPRDTPKHGWAASCTGRC